MMQAASTNPIFQQLMGIRYVISKQAVSGMQPQESLGEYTVYKNRIVAPMMYVTDQVINADTYCELKYPYNQMGLTQYAVVDDKQVKGVSTTQVMDALDDSIQPVLWDLPTMQHGNIKIEKIENGYQIHVNQTTSISVPLDKNIVEEGSVYFLQFAVENEKINKDCKIIVNGQTNKLTAANHEYYNKNTVFTYAVRLREDESNLSIQFGKGSYKISNIIAYQGVVDKEAPRSLYAQAVSMNREQSIGDEQIGSVTMDREGYFITSIPYDEGYTLYIDNAKSPILVVNQAFVGSKISAGTHSIRLLYQAPGLHAGQCLSVLGGILLLLLLFYENRHRFSQNDN